MFNCLGELHTFTERNSNWKNFLKVVVGVLLLGSAIGQDVDDYCLTSFCLPEQQNVGCNPPPTVGGPACVGKSAQSLNLGLFRRAILSQHNQLRSQLATGKLAAFDSAVRMPTLVWDDELARQAGHNARSCVHVHDACRNTRLFRFVGQNLASVKTSDTNLSADKLIRESIQSWWSEFNVTTQAQLDRFPENQTDLPIGHFTQMISDRTWKMGCAVQTWIESGVNSTLYMVCNYSFTNFEGQPVYRRGLQASRCRTGENAAYPGLCSTEEHIFSTPDFVTN